MNESDKLALTAALTMAVLPRELMGKVIIQLAHALTGAMVSEREAKGLSKLSQEDEESSVSRFILLAVRDVGVDARIVDPVQQSALEPTYTPEQENAAKSEAERILANVQAALRKGKRNDDQAT